MSAAPHTVAVVAFDRFQLLDLAGPGGGPADGDPSRRRPAVPHADRHARRSAGALRERCRDRRRRIGRRARHGAAGDRRRETDRIDTLVVVGGSGSVEAAHDETFLADVRALARRTDRVMSVCTGAFVLAAAGLLDGYAATTHWASCDALAARHPDVTVQPDQIYVRDRDRWTSAGVTAGIDLLLARRRARTTAPRSRTRSRGGSSCSSAVREASRSSARQLAIATGSDRVDRRAPALAARSPRR